MPALPVPDLHSRQLAYVALRLALGLNMALHGATRLPDLDGFAGGLVEGFAGTVLPGGLVYAFAVVLPFVEGLIGVLLLLGLWMRPALMLGVGVMLSLIFGTGLQQNWGTIATQMQYVVYFALLLAFLPYNRFALDTRRR
ncbi:MAG: DoxX family membrane protein [Rhodothermales bacterium]|nr:DoxX family membrane protein [Rhodothermales bacterium]